MTRMRTCCTVRTCKPSEDNAMLRHQIVIPLSLMLLLSACANVSKDPGRRTPGVVIDDTFLENVVERDIRASSDEFKGSHIVVVSYNGVVLLAGQVPSEQAKIKATEVAQSLRRVKRVHNELTVGGPTSFFARSNDAWLTTKVKR